jgi:hypothetical protein
MFQLKNLNVRLVTIGKILKEAFFVFLGINRDDKGSEKTGKVAKTVSKGIAYYLSDYTITMLSPITVGFLKFLGWNDFHMTLAMWFENILIAYGFLLFSRNIILDFTLTEAMRSSIEVIWRKNKVVAFFLTIILLLRFSIWDGPERVAIFFKKELPGRIKEVIIIIIFSLAQAAFWTKLYSVGIDGLVGMWKFLF